MRRMSKESAERKQCPYGVSSFNMGEKKQSTYCCTTSCMAGQSWDDVNHKYMGYCERLYPEINANVKGK